MGQICQFSHFPPIFELKCSQIFCYCTFSMPVGSKQLIEQILEKEFFFKNDIFGIFRPKNHKNCQKIIFYFEKWKFFLAHLNHMGRPTFFMFYTFWFGQKSRQKWDIFGIFGPKNHKNGQKTFFYFEKWNFFWHTLIIWEDQHFSCNTLFDSVKKK